MNTTLCHTRAAQNSSTSWPRYPDIYEINTWVWLTELTRRYTKKIDLSSVPSMEWDAIASFGFDAVWLMGVWERSQVGKEIANRDQKLLDSFRRTLPDYTPEDNVGSPYCVRCYEVDARLGGREGLAIARSELSKRGVKLILDFVPNHVAPDHAWVTRHPEYFIRGNAQDLQQDYGAFINRSGQIYACGRDPYFPAWPDVVQLNAFEPGLRYEVVQTLVSIANQCDGVRCDMAMLLLNSIFERTWGSRCGRRPETEYWTDVISTIRQKYPHFIFIAEAYWDLEWELQQQGFDFCYDKKLYDRLEHGNPEDIRLHLCADLSYQNKLLRFIENHDEPRAAQAFAPGKDRAAAVLAATLPGMRLHHEGQFEGRKIRLPVFLGRRPSEHIDRNLQAFYSELFDAVDRPVFHEGAWSLCGRTGWPDNRTFENILSWTWVGDENYLIVLNLSNYHAQARIHIPWVDSSDDMWHLFDLFSGSFYLRDGREMLSSGLYVELGPWNFHFFQCLRSTRE